MGAFGSERESESTKSEFPEHEVVEQASSHSLFRELSYAFANASDEFLNPTFGIRFGDAGLYKPRNPIVTGGMPVLRLPVQAHAVAAGATTGSAFKGLVAFTNSEIASWLFDFFFL